MKNFLEKLLDYYKIDINQYNELLKDVSFEDVPTLDFFNNGRITKEILLKHIANGDLINVYGDYDCDGIMATTILVYSFKKIGYTNYEYYIPTRESDGYAITLDFVKEAVKKDVKLIICVDNGISANEAINYAISHNIDVIIADHHEYENQLPNTPYIIHPFFSQKPNVICSGGFTSYILSTMILNGPNEYAFSLAGISLVSDMMSLVDYNKKVVKLAIKFLNKYHFKPISYLVDNKRIDESIIGTQIAPKVNSIGRLLSDRSINEIVEYFLTNDDNKINEIGAKIDEINNQRRDISKNAIVDITEFKNENAIIVKTDISEGLVGLVANKLLMDNNKLAIVFSSYEVNGILKGSARCHDGISLQDLFKETNQLLLTYGGHANAGGLSLKSENFNAFKMAVVAYARDKKFTNVEKPVIKISPLEITMENFEILSNFGPFGVDNPKPLFRVSDFPVRSLQYSRDNRHILTNISHDAKIVYFNFNHKEINSKTTISFDGTFALNQYKDFFSVNFLIDTIY
jgi:single-stranded-DNA-specific exonuclease